MTDATLSARLDTADAERKAKELADDLRKLGKAGHEMEDGLDSASRGAKDAGTEFEALKRTVATVLTLEAARRVAVFTAELVSLGAAVAETASKYETVFGPSVEGVNDFLDEFATKAGLTTSAAQDLVATAGAIAQGMGFAQAESAGFAEEIVRLSADLGSFNNLPTEDVARRVTAALTGEREGLKQLGIVVSETEVQKRALINTGKLSIDNLTQQEKATATLQIVTERAGAAIGDLDRTQDSLANQTRAAAAEFADFREKLALSAATAVETSGVMLELRDVLERMGGEGSITSTVFGVLSDSLAFLAQAFEEGQIAAGGWLQIIGAIGDVGENGFSGTLQNIREIIAATEEAGRVSREEFEARKAVTDEEREIAEALKDQRNEFERLLRIRNEAIAADERIEAERRAVELAKRLADEAKRAADEAERYERARKGRRDQATGIFDSVQATQTYRGGPVQDILAAGDRLSAQWREQAAAAELARNTSAEFTETTRELERAQRALDEAETTRLSKIDAVLSGTVALADGLGLLDENTRAVARGIADFVSGLNGLREAEDLAGQVASAAGIVGGAIGLLRGLFSNDDAQRIEDARRNYEEALDAFVDELADGTRWERLRDEAEAQARETLDALVESLLAGLPDKIRDDVVQDIQDAFDNLDTEKLKEILAQFGPDGQDILDAYLAHLEAIEEQRKADIKSMEESIAVRMLIAEGRDEEAAALRLQLDRQVELAEARALEDESLLILLETLYELEDAALAAAAAARDAATAQEFRDDLRVRGASGDEAALIRLQIRQAKEIAKAKELLEDGIITQEDFDQLLSILGDEWQEVMAAMAEATTEALEKEMDLIQARKDAILAAEEDLEIRKLLLKGMTDEAAIRRLEIKQRDEYNDAVEAGFDDEFLEDLQQVQADEMAAFIKSLRDAKNQPAGGGFDSGVVGGGVSAPEARDTFSSSFTSFANTDAALNIMLSQLAYLRIIANNTGSNFAGQSTPTTSVPTSDGLDIVFGAQVEQAYRTSGRI